jgi:hypothetical protein
MTLPSVTLIHGLSGTNMVPKSRMQGVGVLITVCICMCICMCMALQQQGHGSAATSARQTRTSQPSQRCNVAAVRFPSWLHSGEAAEMLAHFDQAVTGGAEGIEDDEEVQVDRGNDLAPNAACPITSKGVRLCPTLPHRTLQHKTATCDAECPFYSICRWCYQHVSATLTAVACSIWSEACFKLLCGASADPGDRGASDGSEGLRVREDCHCWPHPQERRGQRSQLPASW